MIRKLIVIFAFLFLLTSCKRECNKLEIKFSRVDSLNTESINVNELVLKKDDSIFFSKMRYHSKPNDILKFDSLPDGKYELKYFDILDNLRIKKFNLVANESRLINIKFDSIDTGMFINKAPISNLKNGDTYRIERKGGGMYGYYVVTKENNTFYFNAPYRKSKMLTMGQVDAIRNFEAELLKINGIDICISTRRMHYKIINKGKVTEITDNTCNWSGWSTLMTSIPIDED